MTAKKECGNLGVSCTGSNNPMLAGNVVALLSPLILIPVFTLAFGLQHYNWESMMAIRQGDDHDLATAAHLDLENIPGGHVETVDEFAAEQEKLLRAGKISKSMTIAMALAFLVLWPMPMYGSGYIFSKNFFTGWVVVGIIWIFCSLFAVGLFPVFEGRRTLVNTVKFIFLDITGKRHPKKMPRPIEGETEKDGHEGGQETKIFGGDNLPEDITPTEKTGHGKKE